MISQEVKHADASTVANCHLCNHHFLNLYEIKESADEEKTLFAAVTRKHQIETDRVIGGIGSASAVTMLRDALLSTALYVCLACAAPVLGARYQRREAQEIAHKTKPSNTDATAATPMIVALAGVGRIEVLESEAIPAGSMLVACEMATDSAQCEISTRQTSTCCGRICGANHTPQHIINLPWLQVGRQGTITSVQKNIIYVTLDALSAPLPVTTVLSAAATLLGIYTGPQPVLSPPPIQHTKVNLNVEQQSSVRGICGECMWRVHVESA